MWSQHRELCIIETNDFPSSSASAAKSGATQSSLDQFATVQPKKVQKQILKQNFMNFYEFIFYLKCFLKNLKF